MKRLGYCTLCEKLVWKGTGEGFKWKATVPAEFAWRVDFLLSDETVGSITFCENCLADIPENMERIWEICLEAYDHDQAMHPGGEKTIAFLAHIHEQHLVKELSRVRWTELKQAGVI